MGLVNNQYFVVPVHYLGYTSDVRTYSVIVGTWQNNCLCLRVFFQKLLYLLRGHGSGYPVFLNHFRVCVYGPDVPQRQCVEAGFVTVSRHYDFPALWDSCQHGRDVGAAAAVYLEIRFFHLVQPSIALLSLTQNAFSLKQIVGSRNLRNVTVHEVVQEFSIPAFSIEFRAFVPRHMEGYWVLSPVLQQEILHRCSDCHDFLSPCVIAYCSCYTTRFLFSVRLMLFLSSEQRTGSCRLPLSQGALSFCPALLYTL